MMIEPNQLELSITVSTSLANHLTEEEMRVAIYANGIDRETGTSLAILPRNQRDQMLLILREMSTYQPDKSLPISTFLSEQSRNLPYATTLIFVSAVLDEIVLATIYHIQRYRQIIIVYTGRETRNWNYANLTILQIAGDMNWRTFSDIALEQLER